MRSMGSYLSLFFMILFWIFRIVVSFTNTLGIDIGFAPLNINVEIILLFITLLCVVLVGKRKILGAIIYAISYGAYFGVDLFNTIMKIVNGGSIADFTNAFSSFIAIAIALLVLIYCLLDKARTAHPVDKQTDWFYKNSDYDRKYDERADRNEYKNY